LEFANPYMMKAHQPPKIGSWILEIRFRYKTGLSNTEKPEAEKPEAFLVKKKLPPNTKNLEKNLKLGALALSPSRHKPLTRVHRREKLESVQNWYRKVRSARRCGSGKGREEAILLGLLTLFRMRLPMGGLSCFCDAAEECALLREGEEKTNARTIVASARCRSGRQREVCRI